MICKCGHTRSFHRHVGGCCPRECQVTDCSCQLYHRQITEAAMVKVERIGGPRRRGPGRPSEDQLWQEELAEEAERDHSTHIAVTQAPPIKEEPVTEYEALTVAPVKVVAKFFRKYGDVRVDIMKLKMRGKLKVVSF